MAKQKQQQPLTPERYIRERARLLPIYISATRARQSAIAVKCPLWLSVSTQAAPTPWRHLCWIGGVSV